MPSNAIGMVGLGRMGAGLAGQLVNGGYNVFGFDHRPNAGIPIGVRQCETIGELLEKLPPARLVLLAVPYEAVDSVFDELLPGLEADDTVADMGNSHHLASLERHQRLGARGIHFLDIGASGGIQGARTGYCLMVGGDTNVMARHAAVFDCLSGPGGAWDQVGGPGTGHFVKTVHNAIEYAFMHALSDGFDLLERVESEVGPVDPPRVAALWNRGSIVRSFLLELTAKVLAAHPRLEPFAGPIGGGQTGRWAVQTGDRFGLELAAFRAALDHRAASIARNSLGCRLVSALRFKFGGHSYGEASVRTDPKPPDKAVTPVCG
jgi:6-phosphogluconate dehydrogenase